MMNSIGEWEENDCQPWGWMEMMEIPVVVAWRWRWDAKSEEGSVANWVMATKEEEGIQLLSHGDRQRVTDGDGRAQQWRCCANDCQQENGVGVTCCCVLQRRTNQGREIERGAAVAIVIFK